ncbi:hypothetical protein [Streptomyces sp. NPDC102476]|uniref:hypothetical protein n=1 Tax=Streptomyces sp. NPDC102476 TaxID=3366181 RepID=UPI00381643F0
MTEGSQAWSGVDLEARRRRVRDRPASGSADATDQLGELRQEFRLGLAGGRAGAQRTASGDAEEEQAATVVTAQLLDKLGQVEQSCPDCHHTFRLGEEVGVERAPGSERVILRHHGPHARCALPGAGEMSEAATRFHEGLDAANPPPPELHPVRLWPGHPLLALHAGLHGGPPTRFACWVCGMTLRPGELVIHCTCSPTAPSCQWAIHRDPDRGTLCYDEWKEQHGSIPCLTVNAPRDIK